MVAHKLYRIKLELFTNSIKMKILVKILIVSSITKLLKLFSVVQFKSEKHPILDLILTMPLCLLKDFLNKFLNIRSKTYWKRTILKVGSL